MLGQEQSRLCWELPTQAVASLAIGGLGAENGFLRGSLRLRLSVDRATRPPQFQTAVTSFAVSTKSPTAFIFMGVGHSMPFHLRALAQAQTRTRNPLRRIHLLQRRLSRSIF
jgi:hypothetical protein